MSKRCVNVQGVRCTYSSNKDKIQIKQLHNNKSFYIDVVDDDVLHTCMSMLEKINHIHEYSLVVDNTYPKASYLFAVNPIGGSFIDFEQFIIPNQTKK